jgi:hypothetical protein
MNYIDGEVFTQDYLDGIAEEINSILQEAGSLRVVDTPTPTFSGRKRASGARSAR